MKKLLYFKYKLHKELETILYLLGGDKTKKLMILILMIILMNCAGCAREMTTREKVLFGTMIAANAADYEITRRGLGVGFKENNPFLTDHPSQDSIAWLKIAFVGGLWGLGEIFPDGREYFFTIGNITGGVAAGWNDRLYREHY